MASNFTSLPSRQGSGTHTPQERRALPAVKLMRYLALSEVLEFHRREITQSGAALECVTWQGPQHRNSFSPFCVCLPYSRLFRYDAGGSQTVSC